MNDADKASIDGLLWMEGFGMLNWSDRSRLENYRQVYPDYFKAKENAAIYKAIDADIDFAEHNEF